LCGTAKSIVEWQKWVIGDGLSRFVVPVDVRFAREATDLLHAAK